MVKHCKEPDPTHVHARRPDTRSFIATATEVGNHRQQGRGDVTLTIGRTRSTKSTAQNPTQARPAPQALL
eukprot:12074771-Alexandrium_andersonii.AAC.1